MHLRNSTVDGISFEVKDPARLEREILPKYFRHRRFQSLVRQLNFYCFKKVSAARSSFIYSHDAFQYNRPDLLVHLQRKKSLTSYGCSSTSSSNGNKKRYVNASTNRYPHHQSGEVANTYSTLDTAAPIQTAPALVAFTTEGGCDEYDDYESDDSSDLDDDEIEHLTDIGQRSLALYRHPSMAALYAHNPLPSYPQAKDKVTHKWNAATRYFGAHSASRSSSGGASSSSDSNAHSFNLSKLIPEFTSEEILGRVSMIVVEFCLGRNPWTESEDLFMHVRHLLDKEPSLTRELSIYMRAMYPYNPNVDSAAHKPFIEISSDSFTGDFGSICGGYDTTDSSRRSGGEGSISGDSEGEGTQSDISDTTSSMAIKVIHAHAIEKAIANKCRVSIVLGSSTSPASFKALRKRHREEDEHDTPSISGGTPKIRRCSSSSSSSINASSEVVLMRAFMFYAISSIQSVIGILCEQHQVVAERDAELGKVVLRELSACSTRWMEYAKLYS